jgi:hypothetical protein
MSYTIAMLTSEGTKKLEYWDTYSEADMNLDKWYEIYPNGWIEIYNDADLNQIAEDD